MLDEVKSWIRNKFTNGGAVETAAPDLSGLIQAGVNAGVDCGTFDAQPLAATEPAKPAEIILPAEPVESEEQWSQRCRREAGLK